MQKKKVTGTVANYKEAVLNDVTGHKEKQTETLMALIITPF